MFHKASACARMTANQAAVACSYGAVCLLLVSRTAVLAPTDGSDRHYLKP